MDSNMYIGSHFYLIGNIPGEFHSYNLRSFFSHLIEKNGFSCFHFRHRPEYRKIKSSTESSSRTENSIEIEKERGNEKEKRQLDGHQLDVSHEVATGPLHGEILSASCSTLSVKANTLCCVVAVKKEMEREFMKYNNQHWTSGERDEVISQHKVRLQQIKVPTTEPTVSGTEKQAIMAGSSTTLSNDPPPINLMHDVLSLPELNPPKVMPQGNVGTPLSVFRALIQSCQLPPSVIRKLKLKFPLSHIRRMYSAVPLDYGLGKGGNQLSDLRKKQKEKQDRNKRTRKKAKKDDIEEQYSDEDQSENVQSDDEFDAEEWERYEALHNDVDKQERTTERLFEEEMEVVWDKGSSGLVFYTDANYWEQQDGDFDEKCSKEDDWDIDMGLYYRYESADKPAQDLHKIVLEQRLREGEETTASSSKLSKRLHEGIGSKLMKEKGWRKGKGLGKTASGITEPLEAEGQNPHCKTGLGYRGEKLSLKPVQKSTREVLISTIYDKPDEEKDTTLRRAPETTLKYRDKTIDKKEKTL